MGWRPGRAAGRVTPAPPPAPGPGGPLRIGSLCTGYGGLELAVTAVLDAEVAWYAEHDPHAAAVLAAQWPRLRNLGDITALDWADVPPVDLITAGWPTSPAPASALALRKGPAVDCGTASLTAFASYDPRTSSWKTSPRSARGASARSWPGWPRSGMTRSGRAYALPMPAPATAATGSSSSRTSQPPAPCPRLLPPPVAGACNDGESVASWVARRDRQKKPGRNGNGIGTPLAIAIRLLPTPDTGTSPNGHGRRGGRPGNRHQSGNGLDAAARTLAAGTTGAQPLSRAPVAWGEYEPAIRRRERVLGQPAPPPAEPGPGGRPRLSAAFAEWMMGIPGRVTGLPGISRTARLRIIGNGVVPHQAAAALRLLIKAAAIPGAADGTGTGSRVAA